MTKRILSLLLAALMVLGSLVVVSAAEDEIDYDAENKWAIDVLVDIEVLQGRDNGELELIEGILRYEMALFIARALTGETDDEYWLKAKNETPFKDLVEHPYGGVATWNYNHEIILGATSTTFIPEGNITYQDAIVMIVRAWADYYIYTGLDKLGFKDELHYPWKHIELADALGLTANIDPNEKYLENTTRGVVAQLIYNLLTWDPSTQIPEYLKDELGTLKSNDSIGEDNFDLVISAKAGDVFEVTGIVKEGDNAGDVTLVDDNNTEDTADDTTLTLTVDDFAAYDEEAKVGSYYKVIYYALGDEVVVTLIEQVSSDGADYANTASADEFEVVYEATAWKDDAKTEAKEWKITGIKVLETGTVYALTGDNKVALQIAGVDVTDIEAFQTIGLEKIDKDEKAIYDEIVDALYATLKLTDTNGDGKIDVANITPYVFAAVYKEVLANTVDDTVADDSKATVWVFDTYAMVPYNDSKVTKTAHPEDDYVTRTWEWTVKGADGKDAETKASLTGSTEYVAKSGVATLGDMKKLSAVTIDKYDIREATENKYIKFVGDDTLYGYTYTDLLAWGIVATYEVEVDDAIETATKIVGAYYDIARNANRELAALYANKKVADDKKLADDIETPNVDESKKYVNAWVIDGKLVAIEYATKDGESDGTGSGSGSETPATKYDGILVISEKIAEEKFIERGAMTGEGDDATALVALVGGKYYYVTTAKIDGVDQDVLIYLADATEYVYDKTASGSDSDQKDAWDAAETEKIKKGYESITAEYNGDAETNNVVFYTVDSNGNYVIVPSETVAVTGETYKAHIGGEYKVALKDDEALATGSYIEYKMDVSSEDFIKFDLGEDDPDATDDRYGVQWMENVATDDTNWLFVTATDIQLKLGVPEYKSSFTVDSVEDIVANGDDLVVFGTFTGFEYTMFADATYAIYDGSEALDWDVRDGYLHYNVTNLFNGEDIIMIVDEEDEDKIAEINSIGSEEGKKVIIAMDADANYELLEVYTIDAAGNSIAAIASLSYGKNAFETTNMSSIEALEERIAEQYNLTEVATAKMAANKDNVVYAVSADALNTENVTPDANDTCYVFFTPATADKAASYVVFVVAPAGNG